MNCLGDVRFDGFLFSFSLEIENGDENAFGWIFENIFGENIFSNEQKTENNTISFFSWNQKPHFE